jgi:hypothetical protein
MVFLSQQREMGALILSIYRHPASTLEIDYYYKQFELSGYPPAEIARIMLEQPDADWISGLSEFDALSAMYFAAHHTQPDPDYINSYIGTGHFYSAAAAMSMDVFYYIDTDPVILAQRDALEQRVAEGLFPSVAADATGGAGDALAMFYLLKAPWLADELNQYGRQLNEGADLAGLAQDKIETLPINNLSDSDFILRLFEQGFERSPTAAELADYQHRLAEGATRGDLLVVMIEQLRGVVAPEDQTAQQHFNDAGYEYQPGELPATVYLEQVAALFRAIPERSIDATSLDTWSKILASGTLNYPELVAALLATPEFQEQVGSLQGDAFIQHVYHAVHGRAADEQQLAHYRALGDDKGVITQAVVDDLVTASENGGITQSEQWAFARDIGQSLAYKTTASLSTSEEGGNAYGTVNTHTGHSLSNAETAVLFRVFLNADADVTVDLSYASQLSYLIIDGDSAAAIQLHNNQNVRYGVEVTVNNANVTLDGTYGGDQVQLTALADVTVATGHFNLSEGNDSLLWAGNSTGGANHVGALLGADGGAGLDILSANLIVKLTSTLDLWGMRVSTVISNAANFSHFEQLDLAGYIGQAEATLNKVSWGGIKTEKLATDAHVFDYGVLSGHATVEGTRGGYVIQDRAADDLGSGGLLLSARADNVKVINANADAARLEISSVGDQVNSRLEIDFVENATHRFDLLFSGRGDAGALALGSHGSENPLELIAITSADWGRNALTLTGSNEQVTDIVLSGKASFDLTLGEGYANVGLIDASSFAGNAFTLNSAHGGSGNGTLIQMLDLLPLSGGTQAKLEPILGELGLLGEQLLVKGGGGNDHFSIMGDTTIIAGAGQNNLTLQSSTAASGVTIRDFSLERDSFTDVMSGLRLSNDAGGSALADYGTSTGENIETRIGALTADQTGSASQLLAALLDLGGIDALSAKVGVGSVLADKNSSYIIIDNNDDHRLDAADSVILLLGQDHQTLLSELRYVPQQVELTGAAATEELLVA